jgi:catechol 2,3-dioxygenase-like lactoylglutathione lyase family enzyme
MIEPAAVVGRYRLPRRMHHHAYVTRDLAATRTFYEDLIGLPLVATWCESEVLFGKLRTYCHCFFALGDGSALTFFQFARDEDWLEFGARRSGSPFIHIALDTDPPAQKAIEDRLTQAGYGEPAMYVLDHGYCRSVYVVDPNGLILEFTRDHPNAPAINQTRSSTAHHDLERWLGGDHRSNNVYRPAHQLTIPLS